MLAQYPKYIPHRTAPDKIIRVETQDHHKRINPEDYERFQKELAGDPTQGRGLFLAGVTAAEERERCAIVAENFPRAGKVGLMIAAAIRGMSDSEEVLEPSSLEVMPQSETPFGRPLNDPDDELERRKPMESLDVK